jgi:hypothetical protein
MKSYANFDEAIGAARKAQEMLDALDQALYTMDGEIPNDDADRCVKEVRGHLNEAGKALGYLASGMWTVPAPDLTERCGICGNDPAESGAQYDMATVTWDGITIKVCSNCVHGTPVSITGLHEAVCRAAPKVAADPF